MTNCKSFTDKLSLMALNELPANETEAVKQHLTECDSCSSYFRELQEVTVMLGRKPKDEITELEKLQIETSLYRRLAVSSVTSQRPSWAGITLRIAAALALITLGYMGGMFSTEPHDTRPEPFAAESQLASLDWQKNIASFRLSPQGLKLIAKGREGLRSN